jgi:NodT family efflux transporter outer membrane factor (OMF) lipoprotein
MFHPLLLALAMALAAAGCTVGPNYVPPKPKLPEQWTEQQIAGQSASGAAALRRLQHWWSEFKDPMLDRLVKQAMAGNYDVKIATQRVVAARAQRGIAASGAYPSIGFGGSAQRLVSSTTAAWPPGIGAYNNFQGGFDASWELDVFGEIRRGVEAADAGIGASIEDRRDILVSLLAELGNDYAILRASQERLAIARRNIAVEEHALTLTQRKYDRGLSSDLDVAQARGQLETVRAVVPKLEAAIAVSIHAIGLLLGRLPGDLEGELSKAGPIVPVPPSLPVSLPSEVVRNRPDIRRAERNVAGATAEVGVAVAQLFPQFSIPLSLGLLTGFMPQLLTSQSLVWGFGLAVAGPVFEGGRLDAQVRLAKAIAEQDRLAYDETVLAAFRDVEDALVNYASEEKRRTSLGAALDAERVALDSSTRLYAAGLTDFLKVLDSERAVYAAEDSLALSDLARVTQTIALFKSLGAGWQDIDLDKNWPAAESPAPKAQPAANLRDELTAAPRN